MSIAFFILSESGFAGFKYSWIYNHADQINHFNHGSDN